MWLFPSLEGKTGKLREQGRRTLTVPLRPGSGERGAQGVWPRRRNREERVGGLSEGRRNQSSSSSWRRAVCCSGSGGSLTAPATSFSTSKGRAAGFAKPCDGQEQEPQRSMEAAPRGGRVTHSSTLSSDCGGRWTLLSSRSPPHPWWLRVASTCFESAWGGGARSWWLKESKGSC